MQSGPLGLNWFQAAGSLGGCTLVLLIVLGLLRLQKWKRDERRERPPQNEKLLRPAGYSATCRMEAAGEALMDALTQAVLAGLVFGISFGTLYPVLAARAGHPVIFAEIWKAPLGWLLIPVLVLLIGSLLWMIWKARMVLEFTAHVRNWRFGLRGEQAVAERLTDRSLVAAGYLSFHDLPGEGDWNIDHVVVGPAGVFVLETKARPRRKATRKQQEHVMRFDGRKLQFPWCYDDKVVGQVERNAR